MSVITNPISLKTRYMRCEITLNADNFNSLPNNNTVVINGSATSVANEIPFTIVANIQDTLSQQMDNSADILIYGLSNDLTNQISTIGKIVQAQIVYQLNSIRLYAGYTPDPPLAYSGQILRVYADYNDVNKPLHLQCSTNVVVQTQNIQPLSISGDVNISDLFSNIASQLGLGFVNYNNQVSGTITNPLLIGSPIDQIRQLSAQTQVVPLIKNGVLSIAPLGTIHSPSVLELDFNSGLIGYPILDDLGIQFKMYFNPIFNVGQYVNVNSYIEKATGQWYAYSVNSQISNNYEQWYSMVRCAINRTAVGQGT